MNWSNRCLKVSWIKCWNIAGALHSLKSISKYSKCPYQVWKAVFHSSTSQIWTRLWALWRSSLVKILTEHNLFKSSLMSDEEYDSRWFPYARLDSLHTEPSFFLPQRKCGFLLGTGMGRWTICLRCSQSTRSSGSEREEIRPKGTLVHGWRLIGES